MSPALRSSSSGSWSRAAPAGDIIDLDRYIRARPHHDASRRNECDRLIVDGGGIRAVDSTRSSDSGATATPLTPLPLLPRRDKRYSHDSGLSDDSYKRYRRTRKHAHHRRAEPSGGATRSTATTTSMRTFREQCERALKDQQEQIARVAQLCERLTVAHISGAAASVAGVSGAPAAPAPSAPAPSAPARAAPARPRPPPSNTSTELSSSTRSRSSRDLRRKDKHRSQECKTYKIIMSKLDELNRLFVSRARSPVPRALRPRRSSASVSVCDKLVATEPMPQMPIAATYTQHVVCRNYCTPTHRGFPGAEPQTPLVSRLPTVATPRSPRAPRSPCAPCPPCALRSPCAPRSSCAPCPPCAPRSPCAPCRPRSPCPPHAAFPPRPQFPGRLLYEPAPEPLPADSQNMGTDNSGRLNVASDSANQCDTHTIIHSRSTVQDPCSSEFDLEDPLHGYPQAQCLASLDGTRLHGAAVRPLEGDAYCGPPRPRAPASSGRGVSLCRLCRGYWRSLRQCLHQQIFRHDAV